MGSSAPRQAGAVVLAVLLYYAIQFPSAWLGLQNPWNAPVAWHESGQWLYMTVHHVGQALLAIIAIAVLGSLRFSQWGMNLRNLGESFRLVRIFSLWFGLIIAASLLIQLATAAPSIYGRPLTPGHVIGGMFFMWFVSGTSEEILFRGLFQTWFSRFWRGTFCLRGLEVPSAVIVAAALFALVHINLDFRSLEITRFSPMQVGLSFALGIFYGIAYHRTGSLLAPALAHNIANGLMETVNLTIELAN